MCTHEGFVNPYFACKLYASSQAPNKMAAGVVSMVFYFGAWFWKVSIYPKELLMYICGWPNNFLNGQILAEVFGRMS